MRRGSRIAALASLALMSALIAGCSNAPAPTPTVYQLIDRMRHEERLCEAGPQKLAFDKDPHCREFGKLVERLQDEHDLCMIEDTLFDMCNGSTPFGYQGRH